MKPTIFACLLIMLATGANAAVKMEPVEYKFAGTTLKGQIAFDDSRQDKQPGVLVVHEWWGLNEYAKNRARMLAEAGYVALAVDMYGDGNVTEHPEEAGQWAAAVRSNEKTGLDRFMAAYNVLKSSPRVDPGRISAIGYCFGGGIVLGAALSGVDLAAAVSFHGSLPTDPAKGQPRARILVCHGAADSFVSPEQVTAFQKVLADSGADWVFVSYSGAKHSFTNPGADARGMQGLGYNEKADKRSWQAMLSFLAEGE